MNIFNLNKFYFACAYLCIGMLLCGSFEVLHGMKRSHDDIEQTNENDQDFFDQEQKKQRFYLCTQAHMLYRAVENNDVATAKKSLDAGADPNDTMFMAKTPLIIACEKNNQKLAQLLLQYKAKLSPENALENTPLSVACRSDRGNLVHTLITESTPEEAQAAVNATIDTGETILSIACQHVSDLKTIALLLQYGATATINTPTQEVNLDGADYNDFLSNYFTPMGTYIPRIGTSQTPLWRACARGHIDIVRLLLDNGASTTITCPDAQIRSPLLMACEQTDHNVAYKLALLLLQNGAHPSINQCDNQGNFPLATACRFGNFQLVQLLLLNGARNSINAVNGERKTPLSLAFAHNHHDIIRLLIANGANLKKGQNPVIDGIAYSNLCRQFDDICASKTGAHLTSANNIAEALGLTQNNLVLALVFRASAKFPDVFKELIKDREMCARAAKEKDYYCADNSMIDLAIAMHKREQDTYNNLKKLLTKATLTDVIFN